MLGSYMYIFYRTFMTAIFGSGGSENCCQA